MVLGEKLREVRELAYLELCALVDELVKDPVERDKICGLEYNSVVWGYKTEKGEKKAYELRVYERRIGRDGKERVFVRCL